MRRGLCPVGALVPFEHQREGEVCERERRVERQRVRQMLPRFGEVEAIQGFYAEQVRPVRIETMRAEVAHLRVGWRRDGEDTARER